MPTQEERLTTLEQTTATYTKETAKRLKETNEHLTMAPGLIQRQSFDISTINNHLDDIEKEIATHFGAANAHLEALQKHADTTDKRLTSIETQLAEQKTLLTQILARLPEKPSA